MQIQTIKDIPQIEGKKIIVRADLNVPLSKIDGSIQDDTRIQGALPTIKYLQERGAKIIIISHLGRPNGEITEELRLEKVATRIRELTNLNVKYSKEIISDSVVKQINELQNGEILVLENIRFDEREKTCDKEFSRQLASLADIYVNDAFGTAHRAHASITGIAEFLPAYGGLLMEEEIAMLTKALETNEHPMTLIIGGAKIDTKIGVIEKFISRADNILVGGGIANTFLHASGKFVGESLFQKEKSDLAEKLMKKAKAAHTKIYIPQDVVVSAEISGAEIKNIPSDQIEGNLKIFDIGENTAQEFAKVIAASKMVIWNGPVGLYEYQGFENGTKTIARAIANNKNCTSIVGGGDSVDAIKRFNLDFKDFTHVSTGGGASLNFLEGRELPGIKVLMHA